MPRIAKGPRLWLRVRPGRQSVWVILDTGSPEISTGFSGIDRASAEKRLQEYIAHKHRPMWKDGDPEKVPISDVLAHYAKVQAPTHAHPELVGFHMSPLIEFFGTQFCSFIDSETCGDYVKFRVSGTKTRRPVKTGTARRELETLAAALNFAFSEKKLRIPVPVKFPAKGVGRTRWLSRSELASLIAGALGIVPVAYDRHSRRPIKWGRMFQPAYHVARFILIAAYTGTRHESILRMKWEQSDKFGWIDLDGDRIYRKGPGEKETTKRRPPIPIPKNLLPHLLRWKSLTQIGPVEFHGRLIQKERRGFVRARELAGLGEDVTPHVLRHTCATWMLQRGVSTWVAAGFLGASEKMILEIYGHHSPDYLGDAARRFK